MHKYTISLLLSLVLVTACAAQILETKELRTIMQHLTADHDLVVFDLDNTLVELSHERGSDQWFSAMVAYANKHGISADSAGKKILPLYFQLHHEKELQLTEHDAHELINHLKNSGKHVIALTLRSLELKSRTIEQLTRLNVSFSKVISHDEVAVPGLHAALYAQGIIFCSGNNKGDVLRRFLDQHSYAPRNIIFVDDKQKYIVMVQEHMDKKGIGCLGFRYGGCDEKVQQFQLAETDKAWIHETFAEEIAQHGQQPA